MLHMKIHTQEKHSESNKVSGSTQQFRLSDHPWLSLAALWCTGIPLFFLGVSNSLILLLLVANSIIFRLIQGFPINPTFLRSVIDLRGDLPPYSLSYINSFPAIFEEILWRGVMMAVFLGKYSVKQLIIMTAFGFGLFHFINLLGSVEPSFVIRQVIIGSAFVFFCGYLVLRTNSLMPAMLFHYLVNMLIGSFMRYMTYAPAEIKTLYLALNLLVSISLLILWVKFFSKRWIPQSTDWRPINLRRESQ